MDAWLMLTARQVLGTLAHNWPFLVAGTLVAAVLQWKLDPQRVAAWLERHRWGVPLAATLGLPLYVNTDASLPLVRAFLDNGASAGAALAFLITGAGTSVGAVAGALAIARIRVITLVVGTLWLGAIVFGLGYDLLAA